MAIFFCSITSNLKAGPFVDMTFDAALDTATRSGKIVLADFYTASCLPCKMLDKTTWTDAAVIKVLETQTVAIRVDAEKEVELSRRYKVTMYPSVLLIKADGSEIDRLVGYRDPKAFMADFNAGVSGKDSIHRAQDRLQTAGTNDPASRMSLGSAFAEKGMDAEALAEFLWCFDHGLDAGQTSGFGGVRLSFLLAKIADLAAQYPPAWKSLEARRDERQAALSAGGDSFQTIQDLMALNRTLRQEGKNLALFDALPSTGGTRAFAATLLTDQLLAAKRYADVLQAGDPKTTLAKALDQYHEVLESVGQSNPVRARIEESLRKMVVGTGAHGLEVLAGLGRNDEARVLTAEILKFDSSQATRALLAGAAHRAGNDEVARFVGHSLE